MWLHRACSASHSGPLYCRSPLSTAGAYECCFASDVHNTLVFAFEYLSFVRHVTRNSYFKFIYEAHRDIVLQTATEMPLFRLCVYRLHGCERLS